MLNAPRLLFLHHILININPINSSFIAEILLQLHPISTSYNLNTSLCPFNEDSEREFHTKSPAERETARTKMDEVRYPEEDINVEDIPF